MARLVNISDVCNEIFAGGDAPKNNMSIEKTDEFSIPIYSNGEAESGLYGYTNFARVKEPSITVSARGTIGYTAIRNEPFVPIVRLISLTPNRNLVDIQYLYYAVQNYHFDGSGTSIPQLTVPMLKEYSFPLPDMGEQKHIASILNKLTSLISLRKQQLAKLDELVKARFVEMFGDRFSNDRNWDTKLLANVVDFCNGKAHEQVVDIAGKYILVTSKCIASDFVEFRTTNVCLFPLQKKDIVMVMSDVPKGRAIAKCKLIKQDNLFTLNQRICCFRNYDMNPCFLCHLLNRHEYFLGFDDGDSQTNLRKDEILGCKLIIPPMYLQEQYAKFVAVVEYKKLTIQQSLDKLEMLKKALMQEYFG